MSQTAQGLRDAGQTDGLVGVCFGVTPAEQPDSKARRILATYKEKKLREGTEEWEILYQKHYEEQLRKHGI